MRPENGIKSTPICLSCLKISHKGRPFKKSQIVVKYLGNFLWQFVTQELSKIAQYGHTDLSIKYLIFWFQTMLILKRAFGGIRNHDHGVWYLLNKVFQNAKPLWQDLNPWPFECATTQLLLLYLIMIVQSNVLFDRDSTSGRQIRRQNEGCCATNVR